MPLGCRSSLGSDGLAAAALSGVVAASGLARASSAGGPGI